MKFYLYRFHPEKPQIDEVDFVAIEIAQNLDDAAMELTQDALGDLYVRHGLEPSGLEITTPTVFTDKRFPNTKYLLKFSQKDVKSEVNYYYGISETVN